MNNRKPEPVTQRDHPYASWSSAELAWIAKRDAQWAAWGYSLAPLTPAPEPVRLKWRDRVFVVGVVLYVCTALAGLAWALLS